MEHETPPVLDLLVEVFEDFRDHFADRLISGVGFLLVMIPLVTVAIFALYVPMGLGMMVGVVLEDELITVIGSLLGMMAGVLLMMLMITVPIMPMYASLGRAVLRNMDDGSDLGFTAPFETATQDVGKILVTSAIVMGMVFAGMMFCYLPGLVAALATGFALPAVIVHQLSPSEAIKRSVDHVMAQPVWHLGFFAVSMGISMVLSQIPLLGLALVYPFLLSFQLRAYVRVFGRD